MGKSTWGIAALCVLLLCGVVRAQVSSGTISGTVKDSSGAALPGANVSSRTKIQEFPAPSAPIKAVNILRHP